jgi:hypothetical protein
VGVAETLAILIAFEIVRECIIELGILEVEFSKKKIVFINPLIIDLYIFEVLYGRFCVADCFLIVAKLLLTDCQVYQ